MGTERGKPITRPSWKSPDVEITSCLSGCLANQLFAFKLKFVEALLCICFKVLYFFIDIVIEIIRIWFGRLVLVQECALDVPLYIELLK